MSQFHKVTLRLLDFPLEILLEILGNLDVYELVRARQICNDVQQAIDSSSELLYLIDLEYFNAIPVTLPGSVGTAVPALRESLRKCESAWQNAHYSSNVPALRQSFQQWESALQDTQFSSALELIPYPPNVYRWSSGVLGFQGDQLQEIMFLQPQLADGGGHNVPTLRRCQIDSEVCHFTFSPAQDLVILLSRASTWENHAYDVSFRSLSEDNVHPEAASSVVKALDNEVNLELFNPHNPKSSIFGDYYGVLFRNVAKADGGAADFLQIWNWKSKDAFQCIEAFDPACEIMGFIFLTNEKLLVANSRELSLYSLVHSSNSLQLVAKFSLPPLRSPFEIKYISFTPIPFPAQKHNQIIAFSMDVSGGPLKLHFTFFVERNTLLELESIYTSRYGNATEDSTSLPWSSWGPNHTRSFEDPSYDPCKHSVFGFRSVSLVGGQKSHRDPRPLCIRDFNPHRVADFKAGNGSRLNQRLIEGDTTISNMFSEPLGSGLPYLETITEEQFVATNMNVEANRVLLLTFEVRRTLMMPQAGQQGSVKNEMLQGFEVLDFR